MNDREVNDREVLQALLDGKAILVDGMYHSFRYKLIGDKLNIRFDDGRTSFDCITKLDSEYVRIEEEEE